MAFLGVDPDLDPALLLEDDDPDLPDAVFLFEEDLEAVLTFVPLLTTINLPVLEIVAPGRDVVLLPPCESTLLKSAGDIWPAKPDGAVAGRPTFGA